MGAVFRALDVGAGREVALKVVFDPDGAEGRRERFLREGQLTARLDHPGILRVHSAGEVEGLPYLAYELVEGARTLVDAFAELPLPGRVGLVRDAARALGHAHAQGIIHRDVKPDNVLLDRAGQVHVADFGLAAASGLERLTQTGAFVGTPTHMAPEQFVAGRERALGPPCDVWGLGVILYQALTGALPFEGASLLELAARVVAGDPPPPSSLCRDVSRQLDAVARRALRPDPAERYADAAALADDLDLVLAGRSPSASSASGISRLRLSGRGPQRRLARAAALALAASALGVLGVAAFRAPREARLERQELLVRARQAGEDVRRLLAPDRSVLTEGDALARLRAELDALRAAAPAALTAEGALLTRSEALLLLLEGLLALEEGRAADAAQAIDALARHVGAQVAAGSAARAGAPARSGGGASGSSGVDQGALAHRALEAARSVSAGPEPIVAARAHDALTQALRGGLRAPELFGWRARARLAAGVGDPVQAREALVDLALLAEARGGAAAPEDGARAVRLHLALDDLAAAEAAMAELTAPPEPLRLAVALAAVEDSVGGGDLSGALGRAAALEGAQVALETSSRRRAAAAARAAAEGLAALVISDRGRPLEPLVAALELTRLLEPEVPLPPQLLNNLLHLLMISRIRGDYPLLVALAALAPDDHFEAHRAVAIRAEDHDGAERLAPLIPSAERGVELAFAAGDQHRAREMLLLSAKLYMKARRHAEAAAACTRLLSFDDDVMPILRGLAFQVRANARVFLDDGEGALEDVGRALDVLPSDAKLLRKRAEVLELLGRRADAFVAARRHALREGTSARHDASVAFVWSEGRATGRLSEVLEVVSHHLTLHPERAGWWARKGWLERQLGLGGATASLEQAARALRAPDSPERLRPLARSIDLIVRDLRAEHPEVQPRLDDLVDVLEQLRGTGVIP